jgi:V/A-type H+-transporting ATPase subunit C
VQATRPADWTYASGNAAAREVRMLPEGFFRELLSEPVPDGLLRRAGETVLRERIHSVEDLYEADRHAEEAWDELLHEVGAACPTPLIEELFELPRLFRSFKSYVKRTQFGLPLEKVPSRFEDADWEALWNDYAPHVPHCVRHGALRAREIAKEEPDRPEFVDNALDVSCLVGLREISERGAGSLIAEYYRHYGAVKGVEMLWRARQAGMDSRTETLLWEMRQEHDLFIALSQTEEENWVDLVGSVLVGLQASILDEAPGYGRLRGFVRAADEWLMAHARDARNVPFGPERVFGYLLGMEAELQNLKIALAGRALGVPGQVLAGRLRAVYA